MGEPFYITTAISYPNGRPHIGHAYEAIAADVIARAHRAMGRDVLFQTGTDEHGLKMVQTARAAEREVAEFAREMSDSFQEMAKRLNISCDRFIRTTDPDHHRASQALWEAMAANGDLYLDRYEGWYSVRDEAFYADDELVNGEGGQRLSPQGTPVEWTAEESWFFRLSRYAEPLLDLYRGNPEFVRPASRLNEVMRFVEGGLSDLSVSRTSFDWGVKVPGSDGHVMYVWVDALTNYLTGAGYPGDTGNRWPADLHLIGKDIVRFHAVYWPAFLMSAGLKLPRQVFAHGFLLNRGEKMSKSTGNVVDPLALADRYGVDALRYFLIREVTFGQDGSWSEEAIVTRCNAELSNSFGNLVQRTLTQIARNCPDGLPDTAAMNSDDQALLATVSAVVGAMPDAYAALALNRALDGWMAAVFACNAYIDAQAPWTRKKTDPARMEAVLATLYVAIAQLAEAVAPVIPAAAAQLAQTLGTDGPPNMAWYNQLRASGHRIDAPQPLFPRRELPAEPSC